MLVYDHFVIVPQPPSCCSSTLQNIPKRRNINILGDSHRPGRLTARRYIPHLSVPQFVPHNGFVKNSLWGYKSWAY